MEKLLCETCIKAHIMTDSEANKNIICHAAKNGIPVPVFNSPNNGYKYPDVVDCNKYENNGFETKK